MLALFSIIGVGWVIGNKHRYHTHHGHSMPTTHPADYSTPDTRALRRDQYSLADAVQIGIRATEVFGYDHACVDMGQDDIWIVCAWYGDGAPDGP